MGNSEGLTLGEYSDLPAVNILNLIHKAAAAMSPLAMSFVQLLYFFCFNCAVNRAVLVAVADVLEVPGSDRNHRIL